MKPKITSAKIGGIKLNRLDKLNKTNQPAPGTYDSPTCAKRVMANHNYSFSFCKKKKTSYLSEIKGSGPSPVSYDLNKSDGYITKGASRGWK